MVMSYDPVNQLTNITVAGAWMSEFRYDARMRRRVRREFTWNGSIWQLTNEVRYAYDGLLVVQERNAQNVATLSYTRGIDLSGSAQGAGGIGGLLALSQHSTPSPLHAFYHTDGNGNVTALVDTQQRLAAHYLYGPFGNALAASGPWADVNLYRFASKETHGHSRLVYYLYRYYSPNVQRWINRDLLGEAGGRNLFRFTGNNPVWIIDPYGLLDYFYGSGGIIYPSGPVPFLNADTIPGNIGAGAYNVIPFIYNHIFGPFLNIGTGVGTVSGRQGSGLEMTVAILNDTVATASVLLPVAAEAKAVAGVQVTLTPEAEVVAAEAAQVAEEPIPSVVYRGGGKNPGNLTPRPVDEGMLSARESLSNPCPLKPGERAPLHAGEPIQVIDTSKLPVGTVIRDGAPFGTEAPGHVSIGPNVPADVVKQAIIETIPKKATQ